MRIFLVNRLADVPMCAYSNAAIACLRHRRLIKILCATLRYYYYNHRCRTYIYIDRKTCPHTHTYNIRIYMLPQPKYFNLFSNGVVFFFKNAAFKISTNKKKFYSKRDVLLQL
jgi:hypothetical protein